MPLPERPTRSLPPRSAVGREPADPDDLDPARGEIGEIGEGAEEAALPDASPNEELLVVLRGIGAAMFLTTRRVIVARDGMERRPRTGIQTFALRSIVHLRLELGTAPSGRIVLWTSTRHEAVSMFFEARSLDRAQIFIETARPLVARQRRSGPGDRPVRPPSGPAGSGIDPS